MTEAVRDDAPEPRLRTLRPAIMQCPDDRFLRERVLHPYAGQAQSLRSAEVHGDTNTVTAYCEFGIEDSTRIDDTGHFNAMEFVVSYTQAAYYLIAKSVQEHLLPVFDEWTMTDYWARQLPNVLITEMRTRHPVPIDARKYEGELSFTRIRERPARPGKRALIVVETECEFSDEFGGRAEGEIRLAITDPPTV